MCYRAPHLHFLPLHIPPHPYPTMSTRYANQRMRIMHDGPHFKLDLKYDPVTRETTRTWVYKKEKVVEMDCHLHIPKAKSSGEKVSLP